jgi:hypothetical protein
LKVGNERLNMSQPNGATFQHLQYVRYVVYDHGSRHAGGVLQDLTAASITLFLCSHVARVRYSPILIMEPCFAIEEASLRSGP